MNISEPTTFQRVIQTANERDASDIHLSAGSRPALRVQGKVELVPDTPELGPDDTQAVLEHLLSEDQQNTFQSRGEIDCAATYGGDRLRVHVYRDHRGISLALRPIRKQLPGFDELNLPPTLKDTVDSTPSGLILIAGPTGAGKTTTRAALLQYINESQQKHIVSLSDTVEYELEDQQSIIHQRMVGPGGHTESYTEALASALREDPDVISVGDLREREAITEALSAAHAGHLVIAEVHAQTTTSALLRLVSRFPAGDREAVRADLAEVLVAAVAQRLIPRVDTDESQRILATEVLVTNDAVKNLIHEGRLSGLRDVIKSGRDDGMHTLSDHVRHLESAGAISSENADQVAATL